MLLRKRTAKTEAPSDAGGTLALALVEFSADWEQTLHNLSRLDLLIEHLYRDLPEKYPLFYPDVLVLPEFFSTGFTMNPDCAEFPDASPTGKQVLFCRPGRNHSPIRQAASLPRRRRRQLYSRQPEGCL